jgi:hypothetical protein
VTLAQDSPFGQVSAQMFGTRTAANVSAAALLSRWTQQHLDTSQFTSLQDTGPVTGAEIGYVPGAGETYQAVADLPSAPDTPLFIQLLSAVNGTTGVVFAVVSPLDPSNPDPSTANSGAFDTLVNTLVWK